MSDSSNSSRYQYEHQPLGPGQFRLFELAASQRPGDPLAGRVLVVDVERHPSFKILSFALEPRDDDDGYERILVSTMPFKYITVRGSLSSVRAVRHRSASQLLWIHNICINQENPTERSKQLEVYSQIISLAKGIVLYIGPESKSTRAALELVSRLTAARKVFPGDDPQNSSAEVTKSAIETYRRVLPPSASTGWKAINELLHGRPFGRVWTIRDIIHARHLTFLWGSSCEVDAQDFISALDTYELHGYPNLIKNPRAHTLIKAWHLRQAYRADRSHDNDGLLLAAVKLAFPLQAVDPRDRIHAALLHERGPSGIPWVVFGLPDYASSKDLPYIKMAQALNLIDPITPFVSMSLAGNTARPGVQRGDFEGLPSWVPDWSDAQEVDVQQLNEPGSCFDAWGGQLTDPGWDFNPPMDFLAFKAAIVDTLDQMSSYQPPRRPADRLNVSAMNSIFFSEWWSWIREKKPDRYKGDGESLLKDWVETIQARAPATLQTLPDTQAERRTLNVARSWLNFLEDETEEETEEIRQFHAVCLPSCGRRFGLTKRGRFCLVPRNSRPGDTICVPWGSKVPFVLREVDLANNIYENVGESYVHGAMAGETVSWEGVHVLKIIVR
ncbi:hypothetical protein B0T16DRAFT_422128 [Cercophora newfieldiana]|uniref:Heterokaryon incompatibility domain-containing protein n=1 Tax=Cercophora newfieldiana TaxID=92897 RepID=A0AA39XRK6_9PEZI|nr:hypothetical protein B0T16DRAFT_422128 [Cercophora newfieldiana]